METCIAATSILELTNIQRAGFENVMVTQKGDSNLTRFISMANDTGLKVPFVHMDCTTAGTINTIWTENEHQKEFLDFAKNTIQICGDSDVETVILHPTTLSEKRIIAPNHIAVDCMNQLLKKAKKSNVKIAIENVDGFSHANFEYLLDNIDDENLGFCFDSGHWFAYTPTEDLLGKYGSRLSAVHLHDNNGSVFPEPQNWDEYCRLHDMHLLPFDGKIDFSHVAQEIAKSNYHGPVVIESRQSQSDDNFLSLAHERARKLASMIVQSKTSEVEK